MVCVWLCVFVFLCAPPSVSMYEVVRTEDLTVLSSVFEGASLGTGIRFFCQVFKVTFTIKEWNQNKMRLCVCVCLCLH